MADVYWDGRGSPWEYDPGPPRNRLWPRLFAETPNYRSLGVAVSGDEQYRWHFGPMFYRGRLGDGQVKVLVVGQEGAQDESLAHRSFVGGTGARMQHVLGHLGITRSYLFLNTFVYPIRGQYFGKLPALAQDPRSPIRRHRERLFDYAASRNDLRLAIAVGKAAKESLASWVQSHGGSADPARLDEAESHVISPLLKMVGVVHPGGASKGGELAKIIADFTAAMAHVARWADEDPSWLPPDPGAQRSSPESYRYLSAPIPFRDLPYGIPWRLGRGGTSSNRRDGQTAIQIYSEDGSYENRGDAVTFPSVAPGSVADYSDDPGDLPYEPPRRSYADFDRGPGPRFARLLQGGLPGLQWPDFTRFGLPAHVSYGTGPIYRGRLDDPALLVVADQESHDDLFTFRALTGEGGQRLQALLAAAGVTRSYGIVRVLPVDGLGAATAAMNAAVDDAAVRAIYAEAIGRAAPRVLLAMGRCSRRLVSAIAPDVPAVVTLKSPAEIGYATDWRRALGNLEDLDYPRDFAGPSYEYDGERLPIPRFDLPFGTLRWQATSGTRSVRALRGGVPTSDYYKICMPGWAAELTPTPLTAAEQSAAEALRS